MAETSEVAVVGVRIGFVPEVVSVVVSVVVPAVAAVALVVIVDALIDRVVAFCFHQSVLS